MDTQFNKASYFNTFNDIHLENPGQDSELGEFATIPGGFTAVLNNAINLDHGTLHEKSVKEIKVPVLKSIEIPLKVDFAYKGSNAEYLILNTKGEACSLEEYQRKAVSIVSQRFPRPKDHTFNDAHIKKLQNNEAILIEEQLKEVNLTPVKIPKTLYDLFYWCFNIEDRLKGEIKEEDKNEVIKLKEAKCNAGKCKSPIPSFSKLFFLYAYKRPDLEEISIHVPKIHSSLKGNGAKYAQVIDNRYMKREKEENYQKVACQLNRRIINYLNEHNADPTNLSWENMHKISSSLLVDINTRYSDSDL